MDAFERVCTSLRVPDVAEDGACTRISEGRKTVGKPRAQVIEHGDLMTVSEGLNGGPYADETGTTGDQQPHHVLPGANAAP
jgi:hypothetical protein